MNSRTKFFVVFASMSLVVLLLIGAVMGKSAPPEGPYRHLSVFTDVLSRIKSEYVEEPNMKMVTVGAVTGLLESLDPFASYLNADQFKDYLKKKDGPLGEVGLLLSKRSGLLAVVGTIPGSPAAQASIAVGDWLESIRGISTRDMPLAYAEILLKGDPGSTVDLSVFRARRPDPQKMTLTRAEIKFPDVKTEMLAGNTGYLRVESLENGKLNQISSAVKQLQTNGAQKLLLDLRNCAAGPPEDGWALANLFVDKGMLGYTQGQRVPRKNYEADPAKSVSRLPLRVVVNRGTAGASEIAAAALMETKRAEIVGERTQQVGSILRTIPIDDGGAVILSVAKFYTPSGKAIPETGVTPTINKPEPQQQVDYDENGNPLNEAPTPEKAENLGRRLATYLESIISDWK
ncbi:MAG: S41 family peptidase [Bryobacteraceae bacterium]